MGVSSKEDIYRILQAHEDTLRNYGVHQYGLFGSFLRGEAKPNSDVDILVEFQKDKKTFDNFMQLIFFLEEVLGRRVDVLTKESLSPYIGPRILQEVEYVTLNS